MIKINTIIEFIFIFLSMLLVIFLSSYGNQDVSLNVLSMRIVAIIAVIIFVFMKYPDNK